jgi:polar amino acid transport system substrate-binding protein
MVDREARGFTVDLVEAAFAAVGVTARFVPLPYARCNLETKRGNLLGCFNTARSGIVEADFLWHKKPMFFAKVQIYSRSGAQRNLSISDLAGKRVAVTNGYEYGDVFDSSTQVIRDVSPNDLSSLRKLALGRVDYAMVYDRVGSMLLKQHAGEFVGRIGPASDLEKLPLYIAFSQTFPDSKRFIDLFDRGFDIISQNGRLRDIEKKWE